MSEQHNPLCSEGVRAGDQTMPCDCEPTPARGRETLRDQWVVVIPQGSWTRCYGLFESYDACVEWLRANQHHPSDVGIYPVVGYDAA